jgi:hypothetical protein
LPQAQSTGSWDLTGGGRNSVVERELFQKKL